MRISDWSSDVCSSDLLGRDISEPAGIAGVILRRISYPRRKCAPVPPAGPGPGFATACLARASPVSAGGGTFPSLARHRRRLDHAAPTSPRPPPRSSRPAAGAGRRCTARGGCRFPADRPSGRPQAGSQGAAYSQEQLESYAAAVMKVQEIDRAWQPKIQQAEDQQQADQMATEATDEMIGQIEAQGLSVEEYNAITQAAEQDQERKSVE